MRQNISLYVLVQGQNIGSGGWHNFGKEDGRILYIIAEYWKNTRFEEDRILDRMTIEYCTYGESQNIGKKDGRILDRPKAYFGKGE
jgi:hypothetical protein